MTTDELNEFLGAAFPGAPRSYRVEHVDDDGVRMRIPYDASQLRPGGTLSGPTSPWSRGRPRVTRGTSWTTSRGPR